MNPAERSSANKSDFTDLTAFTPPSGAVSSTSGNILRNPVCQPVRYEELNSEQDSTGNEPEVIIHRSGDEIERIEFRCSCGCSKTVLFDYDGE